MAENYSFQKYESEHMARAIGIALPISSKAGMMIANAIRKKTVARAKAILNDAKNMKKPIQYTKFTNGAGHKKGCEIGRAHV